MARGIVIVWEVDAPAARAIRTDDTLELGRALVPRDDRTSARHAEFHPTFGFEPDAMGVTCLGARNGTHADGDLVYERGQATIWHRSVVRTGRSVWVAVDDVDHVPPADAPLHERFVEIPALVHAAVCRAAPSLRVHATAIERCLLSAFERDGLVAEVEAAARRCLAAGHGWLRGEHLESVPPLRPQVPFTRYFERVMNAPPPFPLPETYEVLSTHKIDRTKWETMIGAGGGETLLVQADVGRVFDAPPGWFRCGFWGHGVNSYAVYLGRATERTRLFLRLAYGAGVYEADPEAGCKRALETLAKYSALVEALPAKRVVMIESMGVAYYEIERHDGRVVKSEPDTLSSLDEVDFPALVA